MIDESPSAAYPHHRYVVSFRNLWTPASRIEEIKAWCYDRWGNPLSSSYYVEAGDSALESRWIILITTIRLQTYADAFEYHMRWGAEPDGPTR